MPDDATTDATTDVTPAAVTPVVAPQTTSNDVSTLPEWAQTLITGVRGEAATYRTKLRAVEATVAEKDNTLAAATAALEASKAFEPAAKAAEATVAKMRAALLAGVKPDPELTQFTAFVNTIQGEDEAGMKTHVETILGLAASTLGNGRPLPDKSQGATIVVPANDGTAKGMLESMLNL